MALEIEKQKTWPKSQTHTEGSLWEICLFAVFFIVIFSAVSRANAAQTPAPSTSVSSTATVSKKLVADANAVVMKPSARLAISTSRPIQEDEPESYSGSYDLTLALANFVPNWSASTRIVYSREYSYQKDDGTDGAFENPSASISRKFVFDRGIDALTWRVSGSLPANREATRRHFMGSLGTSVTVAKTIRRLGLTQTLGYTRGFYEYDIRADGTVNSPDSYRSTTELSLDVTDKLSISAAVALTHAINYQGNGKTAEASSVSVDYSFTKNLATSLGLATDRSTLESDGQSNTVKLVDPDVAQAFFDLVLSF